MIRVLWKLPKATAWTGGVNYFRNLANALSVLPERTVEPILLGSTENLPEPLCHLPSIPKYQTPSPSPFNPRHIRSQLERLTVGQDRDYDRYLRRHRIDILSHLAFPAGQTDVPCLTWIPDFQHRYLPHFFSSLEINKRNRLLAHMVEVSQGILLSSEDARQDFNRFYPGHEDKAYVLRFVSIPLDESELPKMETVLNKYGINEPFFHVPNQVWAHKNHRLISDALSILRKKGCCPLVISTGQTEDYRDLNYFKQLYRKIQDANLESNFRFLGMIDYNDVCVLMRSSLALINPSLFEGWSTTVEEAKSYGKRMLLSSLAVHREQAYERSSFFDPNNSEQLALLMEDVITSYDQTEENAHTLIANEYMPKRIKEFGITYENIIRNILK